MDREAFVAKYRPELMGFFAELWAIRNEKPSALGVLFDATHGKARKLLAEMWHDLQPPAEAEATTNGHHNGGHTNGRRA